MSGSKLFKGEKACFAPVSSHQETSLSALAQMMFEVSGNSQRYGSTDVQACGGHCLPTPQGAKKIITTSDRRLNEIATIHPDIDMDLPLDFTQLAA